MCGHRQPRRGQGTARWPSASASPRSTPTCDAALDAEQPDLVDLITPPATHREFVGQAVRARRCRRSARSPSAPSYAEARGAHRDGRARAGVPLIVHENFRWMPWYREAQRADRRRRAGHAALVAFRLRPGDGQGPRAYLDRQPYFQQMPRLLVLETAIHWIDTFRYLMGEVSGVYAQLRRVNPVIAGEDAGYIVFEFAGGVDRPVRRQPPERPRRRQPAPHDGRDVARGLGRRAAPGRRSAPVVEAAPAGRAGAPLRPRARRQLRRRRLRMAAAPRGRAFHTRRAGWRTRHASTCATCACRKRSTARPPTARRIELDAFDPLQPEAVGAGAGSA